MVPYSSTERKAIPGVERSHAQPHLVDWNRDGHTNLILDGGLTWALQVSGPLVGQTQIETKRFPITELPNRTPYDIRFTDWDGDGVFDMLFAGAYLNPEKTEWLYDIYWCRNTSRVGAPKFGPPVRLLEAPSQSDGWQYNGFAVRNLGQTGLQELVVSVSKDWVRKPTGGWTNKSRLMLYRRNVAAVAVADGG